MKEYQLQYASTDRNLKKSHYSLLIIPNLLRDSPFTDCYYGYASFK